MRNIIALLSIVVAMASCNGNRVYDHYEHTSVDGWDRVDTLVYCVRPLASDGRYATTIGLRANGAYPFQCVTLVVEQRVLPAGKLFTDTLDCRLFSDKGVVKGYGVGYYQYNFRVSERALRRGDSLRITVRHAMRRETIPGIADVGIEMDRL